MGVVFSIMPEGPFGLPRLSSLGPFVSEDAEQEVIREVEEQSNFPPDRGIQDKLIEEGILTDDNPKYIRLKLVYREPIRSDRNGILGEIEKGVKSTFREETAATASYYIMEDDSMAFVGLISVEDNFRRNGIGTSLKQMMIDDMKDHGVSLVYTVVSTKGGRSLAEKTGFSTGAPHFEDDGSVMYRRI